MAVRLKKMFHIYTDNSERGYPFFLFQKGKERDGNGEYFEKTNGTVPVGAAVLRTLGERFPLCQNRIRMAGYPVGRESDSFCGIPFFSGGCPDLFRGMPSGKAIHDGSERVSTLHCGNWFFADNRAVCLFLHCHEPYYRHKGIDYQRFQRVCIHFAGSFPDKRGTYDLEERGWLSDWIRGRGTY